MKKHSEKKKQPLYMSFNDKFLTGSASLYIEELSLSYLFSKA